MGENKCISLYISLDAPQPPPYPSIWLFLPSCRPPLGLMHQCIMAAPRLAKLLTSTYACRLNAQLVYPSQQQVVKPNELESALARPMQVAFYEPHQSVRYPAATLLYGIIKGSVLQSYHKTCNFKYSIGHPFLGGNKRTGELAPLSFKMISE